MFAPEGYLQFDDFAAELEELIAPYIQEREAEFQEFARKSKLPYAFMAMWRSAIEASMALLSIEHQHEAKLPIRVCSPDGKIVIPSINFFITNKTNEGCLDLPNLQSSIEEIHSC